MRRVEAGDGTHAHGDRGDCGDRGGHDAGGGGDDGGGRRPERTNAKRECDGRESERIQ